MALLQQLTLTAAWPGKFLKVLFSRDDHNKTQWVPASHLWLMWSSASSLLLMIQKLFNYLRVTVVWYALRHSPFWTGNHCDPLSLVLCTTFRPAVLFSLTSCPFSGPAMVTCPYCRELLLIIPHLTYVGELYLATGITFSEWVTMVICWPWWLSLPTCPTVQFLGGSSQLWISAYDSSLMVMDSSMSPDLASVCMFNGSWLLILWFWLTIWQSLGSQLLNQCYWLTSGHSLCRICQSVLCLAD